MEELVKDKVIEVENLTRKFGRFTAVDGISFFVRRSEIFGILGANGAGKTTTIRMLTGLLKPTSGRGYVAGLDINREYEKIKWRIGYMSQKFSLYDDLTVWENIDFFCSIYGLSSGEIERKLQEMDPALGVMAFLKRKTSDLPPGIKQRLALTTAILHEPEVLFLDEPTSGVDPIMRRYFWDVINMFASRGMSVVVTTHYMDEAEYCNRLMIMHEGGLKDVGTPAELKGRYGVDSVEDVFVRIAGSEVVDDAAGGNG